MSDIRKKLIEMLNKALELEHAARIQYLAHAEMINGLNSEPLVERLKEIASDEQKHEEIFRTLVTAYLGGKASMNLDKTYDANGINEILSVNLKGEREAVDYYKQIYKFVLENKQEFQYEFETLEHQIRHVIIDEQEHIIEISNLLQK